MGVAAATVIIALVVVWNHRRKVQRDCERQLNPKRNEFSQTLEKQFTRAIDSFCAEMAKKFRSLSDACQTRLQRYQPWSERANELDARIAELKQRLG